MMRKRERESEMGRIREDEDEMEVEVEDQLNRGAWTAGEDKTLTDYINAHGEGKWRSLPNRAGLKRCGKSCRLRWLNYLRPDIKRGNISQDEQDLILRLHKLLGNRWSLIAGRLPGRTDNEIKNYWNTIICKKLHPPPRLPRSSSSSNSHNTQKPSSAAAAIQLIPPPPNAIKTKPTRLISSNSKLPFMITSTTTTATTATATTSSSSTLPIFDDQMSSKQQQQQPCSLMIMPSSSDNNNNIHKFVEFGFPSTSTGDFHQNIITTPNNSDYGSGLLFPENFNWMGDGSGGGGGGGINTFDGGNVNYDDIRGVFSQFAEETGVVMEDWVLD